MWLWLVLAVAPAILPYVPSLGGGFALDDWQLVVQDPLAHSIGNWRDAFFTDFLRGSLGKDIIYYRPLVTISYQLNYSLFGPDPLAFRLTNILLNALVAVLVFFLGLRLTKSAVAAGLAALAFAVLPSHAESVAWISGRTDVMSVLFMLASLLAFAASCDRREFNWPLALASSLAFLCALLSKEQALVLPVLLVVYAWISGKRMGASEALKWAAVLLIPLVAFLLVRRSVVGVAVDTHLMNALGRRLLGVGIAYASYLRMLFLPRELQVVYDVFPDFS